MSRLERLEEVYGAAVVAAAGEGLQVLEPDGAEAAPATVAAGDAGPRGVLSGFEFGDGLAAPDGVQLE
jgi:hypothetical protein